jgi:hypothetical protein
MPPFTDYYDRIQKIRDIGVIKNIECNLTSDVPWLIWNDLIDQCAREPDVMFLNVKLLRIIKEWKSFLDSKCHIQKDLVMAVNNAIQLLESSVLY